MPVTVSAFAPSRHIIIAACIFFTALIPAAIASDFFVEGTWSVTYLVIDPQKYIIPPSIRSKGFTQTVRPIHRGYYITVSVDLEPVDLEYSFSFRPGMLPEGLNDPGLAKRLSRVDHGVKAVRIVLGWVAENIAYSDDSNLSQTCEATLERRSGNCEGRTNVALALLKALGIHAGTVSGCHISNGKALFHRWIEIDYPRAGSFPSEPGVTQDFVDPYHIVLSLSGNAPRTARSLEEMGVTIRKIMEKKVLFAVDERKKTGDTLRIRRRRMRSVRYYAAIAGSVSPMRGSARIRLTMDKLSWETEVDAYGNYDFTGLGPGSFTLTLLADWSPPLYKFGELGKREFRRLDFRTGF